MKAFLLTILCAVLNALAIEPCQIQVLERGSKWPVPLIELRATHSLTFFTDNNGLVACDAPELMGREIWFDVIGDGYEVPKDGFGYRGVRLTPAPGKKLTVEVRRTIIARCLGRLTGGGIFAESQKLGLETGWRESGVFGCDSVQNAVHDGRMFWLWGDTTLPAYPLGIFDSSSATTAIKPLTSFEPPLRVPFNYFTDSHGKPRGVAKMQGSGPTWLAAYVSLPDSKGQSHLVATYTKIKPPLEAYEIGLCVWNDLQSAFERLRVLWNKSENKPKPLHPQGHPSLWKDPGGKEWLLLGDPLPRFRCPPTFEAWQDPSTWETLTPQQSLVSALDGKPVKLHSGHIAWNGFRQRWVIVFMEAFGKPSAFGELWYAEAASPLGPWGKAIKVLTHANYTFYNPRLHPELTETNSPILLFEGSYTTEFANHPHPTPRYNYNQVLYRLDLDDPSLKPAQDLSQ